MSRGPRARWWQTAGGIAGFYMMASVAWIVLSDRVVAMLFGSEDAAHMAQSVKGIGWLSATSVALYFLIRSSTRAELAAAGRAVRTEGLLREMGATVEDVFWVTAVNPRRALYVSPGFERVWGRKVEEFESNPWLWSETIVEEDRARTVAAFDAVAGSALTGTYEAEYRVRRPDGSIVWVRDRGYPVMDADGRVVRIVGLAEDITERRCAEEKLRERDLLLRKLSEQAPGVIYQFRMWPDGRSCLPYAGEGIRAVFEVSPEEVREDASKILAMLHPDDHDRVMASVLRSRDTLEPWDCEYRVTLPARGVRWLEGHSVPERLEDGSTLWHGFIHDVTARREAGEALVKSERALKEANERLQAILENSPNVAIQGYEADGRVAFWNKASEALYGWSAEQMVGRRLGGRALSEADDAEFLRVVTTALETGQPAAAREWRMVNAQGRPRWCLSSIFPVRFGDGRSLVICMDVDITSRREIESALRESEERFRQLTEAVREVFWLVDWRARRTLHLSSSFETTWGMPRSAVYSDPMAWTTVIHPEDRARVVESFRRDAPIGKYDLEFRLLRSDGSLRWIHDRAFPILDDNGKVWRVAGVAEDITDRKIAEHRQSLLMQELDHRVKNNLAAALSLADMTARHSETLDEFQEVFTGRLAALARMHALLALTRWHGVRMGELTMRTMEPFLGRGGGKVTMDGPDGMLTAQVASPMCMALHELTTNAAKHGALGAPGGSVEVRWEMDGPVEAPTNLRLWWRERGGPPVSPPTQHGFGTTLIKGAIEYQLDGLVEMRFEPDGLACRIEVDFARTAEPAGRWREAPAGAAPGGRAES